MEEAAQLFVVSAASEQALSQRIGLFAALAERRQDRPLIEFARNTALGQVQGPHRCAIVASSMIQLAQALRDVLENRSRNYIFRGQSGPSRCAWIFSGIGSQSVGMARGLFEGEPVFRSAIAQCQTSIAPYVDWSLAHALMADEAQARMTDARFVQPLTFAIQVALATLWRRWGVEPDAVIGHSMGEVAAAHVAGAIDLDTAAKIICIRSDLLKRIEGQGAMASVALPRDVAESRIATEESLGVAVSNGRRDTVISGDEDAMTRLLATLEAEGVRCARLTSTAGHSPQLDPFLADLQDRLGAVRTYEATTPFYSTVDGAARPGPSLGAAYWADNLRRTVLFGDAVNAAFQDGCRGYLEISPHPILLPSIEEGLRHRARDELMVLPSLRRGRDDRRTLLLAAAQLYAHGTDLAWEHLYPPSSPAAHRAGPALTVGA